MSPCQVVVRNVRAVGMHHHGPRSLTVNGRYSLQWDPDCIHDLGNAVAVVDRKGITRAYLARDDAHVIASLFCANVIAGRVVCKPTTEAHVVTQQRGPQHECDFTFKTDTDHVPFIDTVLNNGNINYTLIN